MPSGAVTRPHTPKSVRSVHLLANQGAERVPSLSATMKLLRELDGADWGLTAAGAA